LNKLPNKPKLKKTKRQTNEDFYTKTIPKPKKFEWNCYEMKKENNFMV
jgi:hypothetical protein